MSEAHSHNTTERDVFPVRLSRDARHLTCATSNANSKTSQNVNTVTALRTVMTVQGRQISPASSDRRVDAWSMVGRDQDKLQKSLQHVSERKMADNGFLVDGSSFPTRKEKGQAPQVSGGQVESRIEYKTVGNPFSNQSPIHVQGGVPHEYRADSDRVSEPGGRIQRDLKIIQNTPYLSFKGIPRDSLGDTDTHSYASGGGGQRVTRNTSWPAAVATRDSGPITQTRRSLRSQSVDSRVSSTAEGQEQVHVRTFGGNVHGSPANQIVRAETTKLQDNDIRDLGSVTDDLTVNTQTSVDSRYTIRNQDIRCLTPTKTERELNTVIVNNLRLDGTPGEWKRLTVKPIEEQEERLAVQKSFEVDTQRSQSIDQRLSSQTKEYRVTRVYSTSVDQEPIELQVSNVQQLRQVFGKPDSPQQGRDVTQSENKISRTDSNTFVRSNYIVRTTSTSVERSVERQPSFQEQVTLSSPKRTFREVEVEKRRERRAARRSSSDCSSGSVESCNMGNETQKMAQADVTVEEDAGGNKMIVVEGRNIRVHSENYDTGKQGAKRVVLVPESARSGKKQLQSESEESVNSYDSYNKRGQKEKMVVTNGRLRESTYTGPNASVKVAKISTPITERKEVSLTPQPQSSEENIPRGRVTRVNVVKRQVSSSTSEGQSLDEARPQGVKQSVLLFEKPQHAHHQRMHMGENGIAQVRRLTHQSRQAPDMVKEVTIRPQQAVIGRAEPRRDEKKIIRVANSAHLARSLKGDDHEIILEKSPPPKRIVRERVLTSREGAPPHIGREQNVQEVRHAQVPPRPKPLAQVRQDDDNVFNSQYYVRKENPLFAERNTNRDIYHHGHVVFKQAEANGDRNNRHPRHVGAKAEITGDRNNHHAGHVVPNQADTNGNRDNRHLSHVTVQQASQHAAGEPLYATVNKVRNQGHPVQADVHVTPVSPIIYKDRPKQSDVQSQKATGSNSKEYGLSALLARQAGHGETKVERKIVHDEVEGEITETKLVAAEAAPVAPERRSKKESKVQLSQGGPLPRNERLAHVIVEESITPTLSRRVEGGIKGSHLESGGLKGQKSKATKNAKKDADVKRSGTSSLLTHRTLVDSNAPASSELTAASDGFGSGEKHHTTHWLIPDVSSRSEGKEKQASVAGTTYRTNMTVGPRVGTVAVVARDVTDLVVAPKAKKRPVSDSEVKCQTQSVYYINIKDDTPLEVNLEPADNVMDIGHGGIYIEDVHPNLETINMSERSDNDDTASVRTMYYTEIDMDKNLSCLLPGWRNEEDEDVLKNIDAMDEDEGVTEARTSQTERSNLQVSRGNILIKNAMSASNGPKYIDVVDDSDEDQNKEKVEVDDIANVFDNQFHVNRENPLYNSDNELKEESRNVRERFAPHNKLGRSDSRNRDGQTGQSAHNASYFDGDTGFNTSFSTSETRHGYSRGYTGGYLMGHQSPMITRTRKVNSEANGLVYSVPKAVFRSMTQFDRQRVGDGSNNEEDVLLSNAKLPDQFFYAYEGSKLRKHMRNGTGNGQDTVDGQEQITATVSSNVHSERQTLEEMAATRQQRIKPNSNSVRQNVHVDHEESDIKGEPHLCHADGSDANSRDLLTFDTVSEDVNLGVKDGVAQVEVKVRCERVSPIEGSTYMWRKSAVIITRLIQIDLEANEERRELYRKILTNEVGGKPMIGNKPANQGTFRNGEVILDKNQTFHVYSALIGIADEEEREALSERRPSKLLSIDSGEPEETVGDVHRYVKARRSMKKERSHRKHHHHHHSSKRGEASPSGQGNQSDDLLY